MTEIGQTRILSEADGPRVRAWLENWLFEHIGGWAPAYGLAWGPDEIRKHIARHALVEREWAELVCASTDANCLVRIMDESGEAVGIVYSELTEDRYVKLPVGIVSWIYVDPTQRGTGIAATLIALARAWHSERGAIASEVFATISNTPAIHRYTGAGFIPVDYRLVAMK